MNIRLYNFTTKHPFVTFSTDAFLCRRWKFLQIEAWTWGNKSKKPTYHSVLLITSTSCLFWLFQTSSCGVLCGVCLSALQWESQKMYYHQTKENLRVKDCRLGDVILVSNQTQRISRWHHHCCRFWFSCWTLCFCSVDSSACKCLKIAWA